MIVQSMVVLYDSNHRKLHTQHVCMLQYSSITSVLTVGTPLKQLSAKNKTPRVVAEKES